MRKSATLGFTLVELLIVIIVVSVLASIAIPKFANSSLRAKESAFRAQLDVLRKAADRAEADTGLVFDPARLAMTSAPTDGWKRGPMGTGWIMTSVDTSTWRGPYIEEVPLNPINNSRVIALGSTSSSAAWSKMSNQTFNTSYLYMPSTALSSEGTQYRTW
jgi:prepilin-type N-terminal cleavage/methylation domain-containing protein